MADIVLRDIDPVLAERIRRIGDARGWSAPETLLHVLEDGLHALEGNGNGRLSSREDDVLQSAIAAMQQVPDDPGFALIGRAPGLPSLDSDGPDQSIHFSLE